MLSRLREPERLLAKLVDPDSFYTGSITDSVAAFRENRAHCVLAQGEDKRVQKAVENGRHDTEYTGNTKKDP
ncbi:unnamed protein product [Bursaphelenchus xylophilus]|uniref:(pine wood nematode) hypothetical protein n=1 Tax=Bursaphelenchus xylophilus TaxID=6326 RepID=A0A1I7RTG3_BURXY|nr:unnamed protein product [Bursaphelenchus xylophilus]CAG9122460.1 unnamed protein product [Bursaphelenchus xylophilus]